MRRSLLWSLALFAALAGQSRGEEPNEIEARLLAQVRQSVASLVGFKDGREFRATGFVVARPDGKKVLVTAGHVFLNGMTLSARLPGMSQLVPCELIAVSNKHDLMVIAPVKPIDAAPLPLLGAKDPSPRLGTKVATVGCPGGLDWTQYQGEINAEPITAAELHRQLATPKDPAMRTPDGEVVLLRHSTFSHPGMSGGPLVDARGRVIGVQIGTLPKASNVSFGVHARHVADLDLGARPRAFIGGPEMKSDIGNVLATPRRADPAPLLLRIGGEDVDGRCFHYGYVPTDAKTVLDRYIQDKKRFRDVFADQWLQKFLDRTSVAHITNPTLGFRVLVPKGYEYTVASNRAGTGVVVVFRSPDVAVPEAHRTITIRAYVDEDAWVRADREAAEAIRTGKTPLPKEYASTQANRDMWHGVVRDSSMTGLAETLFWKYTLGIKLTPKGVKIRDPKDPLAFQNRGSVYTADLTTAWTHSHYDSVAGDSVHSVHYAVRGRVTVIVHYQTRKKDRDNFEAGNETAATHVERAFITATVSLY